MFQLSDTPSSAVNFFMYTKPVSLMQCEVDHSWWMLDREVSGSWKQSDNEKGLAIVHRWVIDREPLNSEYLSECPVRHNLFDCEIIIAPAGKALQEAYLCINGRSLLFYRFLMTMTYSTILYRHAEIRFFSNDNKICKKRFE